MEAVMIDVLHTVDLGVAHLVVANILWEVKDEAGWGTNIKDKVAGMRTNLLRWQEEARPPA
eukprot:11387260-Alexandrium_andersonii.AAC.1